MLQDRAFAVAMSCPLQRARETAERAGLDVPIGTTDDLMEWDHGTYEGITTDAVRHDVPDWTVWTHPIIDGETVDDVGRRADSVIERTLTTPAISVLFAHGHVLRILAAGGSANRLGPVACSHWTPQRSRASGSNANTA